MAREQIISEWMESTKNAIRALEEWRHKLAEWQRRGCDNGEFHTALFTLRSKGLEGWADGHPAGLDALAEAVTGAEQLADELGEAEKPNEGNTAPNSNRPEGRKSGRRWREFKMVRGYGPYEYERWFEGGHKRSRYIGKVQEKVT